MRREYVYISILIASIAVVLWGIVGLLNTSYNVQAVKSNNKLENIYENEVAITTAVEPKKVSPNSDFALKKYYEECNHFDYEEAELPKELVNLTREEVEEYYSDWEVEKFTPDDLVLAKDINGYCNQHFVIKLDEENVSVYRLGNSGELTEYKITEICREYLPEEDIENLENGISVYGEGKLSSALEDFEWGVATGAFRTLSLKILQRDAVPAQHIGTVSVWKKVVS